jgi:multiple sugar transport system permease protein
MEAALGVRLLSATQVIHWRNPLVVAVLSLGGVLMLLPFLWMLGASLRLPGDAYVLPPSVLPEQFEFTSYRKILDPDLPYLRMYLNSIVVATLTTTGVLISCAMAAFAFARLKFAGRALVFPLMLVGLLVPPSLLLIPVFFELAALGLLNSIWSIVLAQLASSFGIYIMRQFMLRQPRELEEAALVDGAGYWCIFWKISLPQLGPAMATLGIITFTASWNNFITPFMLIKSADAMTLPVGILMFHTGHNASLSIMMAATAMAILPLFIIFLIAQRFIIEGITSASGG